MRDISKHLLIFILRESNYFSKFIPNHQGCIAELLQ